MCRAGKADEHANVLMEMFGVGIPSTLTFAYEPPTTRFAAVRGNRWDAPDVR